MQPKRKSHSHSCLASSPRRTVGKILIFFSSQKLQRIVWRNKVCVVYSTYVPRYNLFVVIIQNECTGKRKRKKQQRKRQVLMIATPLCLSNLAFISRPCVFEQLKSSSYFEQNLTSAPVGPKCCLVSTPPPSHQTQNSLSTCTVFLLPSPSQ